MFGLLIIAAGVWYVGARLIQSQRQGHARLESQLAALAETERLREVDEFNRHCYPALCSRPEEIIELWTFGLTSDGGTTRTCSFE